MSMPKGEGVVPVEDKNPNPPIQPVPKDHEEQTPEWLANLIDELNEVRTERGQVLSESMAPTATYGSKGFKSDVQASWERQQRDSELDRKEDSLMAQIRNYMHLLPPDKRPRTLGYYPD